MCIRLSRFLSLIFPPTVNHGPCIASFAWKRTTHMICSSCKLKLEHTQTSLGTWVCLTQNPSDTLRPFREINCHTLYTQDCRSVQSPQAIRYFSGGLGKRETSEMINARSVVYFYTISVLYDEMVSDSTWKLHVVVTRVWCNRHRSCCNSDPSGVLENR
jgi:hypothetical protein